jgi:hypothetical protein
MRSRHVYGLAAALTFLGVGYFIYKVLVVGLPLSFQAKTDLWEVETAITFEAKGQPVKLAFQIPKDDKNFSIVNQSFVSRGYGISTEGGPSGNRRAVLSIRRAEGKQAVYYGFVILRARSPLAETVEEEPVVAPPNLTEQERIAAEAIMQPALRQSADTPTFVVQVLRYLNDTRPLRPVIALLGKNPTVRKKIAAAARIMALAQLPARTVHGITLGSDRAHAQFDHWLEVHDGKRWLTFVHDATGPGLPADKFVWWRGPAPFSEMAGGDAPKTTITVKHIRNPTLQVVRLLGDTAKNPVITWSLFNLPLQTQLVFRLLLVVPVGVFLLVVLRNVIGIKTFGTFMPVLIALAFRETHLAWGITLFVGIVSTGLLVRLYLENLKLLLVPRLAAVLIVVILVMAGVSTLSHKLDITSGLSVALFPIVIMTMTIERMSITWDELGAGEAIREGIGSLIVAIICYLVMTLEAIQHLFFAFPELLLIVLAATVLLGRYSGYRLTEIARFRVLGGDKP